MAHNKGMHFVCAEGSREGREINIMSRQLVPIRFDSTTGRRGRLGRGVRGTVDFYSARRECQEITRKHGRNDLRGDDVYIFSYMDDMGQWSIRGADRRSARRKCLVAWHLWGYEALWGKGEIFLFRTTEYHPVTFLICQLLPAGAGCQLSVAQCVCLRPGWPGTAIVVHNGELAIDHRRLGCQRFGSAVEAVIPAARARDWCLPQNSYTGDGTLGLQP